MFAATHITVQYTMFCTNIQPLYTIIQKRASQALLGKVVKIVYFKETDISWGLIRGNMGYVFYNGKSGAEFKGFKT